MESSFEAKSESKEKNLWITDLQEIERLCVLHAESQYKLSEFLKMQNSAKIDTIVHTLSQSVAAGIDCTKCANCCKSLTVAVNYQDMTALAGALNLEVSQFKAQFMKKDPEKGTVFARRPCPLLKNNMCSVYHSRPSTCRTYPHLEKGQFISRLGNVLSNLKVCPIAFNTFELLKLNFE